VQIKLDGECIVCGKKWENIPATEIFTQCDTCEGIIDWYDPDEEEAECQRHTTRPRKEEDWG